MSIPKRIVTDLSVKLTGLNDEDVRRIMQNTIQDIWVGPFVNQIVEDFKVIDYGMASPDWLTVRDLAVHAYNRFAYYTARNDAVSGDAHRFMDLLLSYTAPMEGALPITLRYRENDEPFLIHEQIGKFNFDTHVNNVPELTGKWRKFGWKIQPTME